MIRAADNPGLSIAIFGKPYKILDASLECGGLAPLWSRAERASVYIHGSKQTGWRY